MKPDLADFNAADYLEYDINLHAFIPKRTQTAGVQNKILNDIKYLGLNFQPTIDIRRQYLAPVFEDVKYKVKTFEEAQRNLTQFYTAFELSREYMDK